ncbi:MAG: hypothetical protein AAGF04_04850 [Chlamydiota bacterium]
MSDAELFASMHICSTPFIVFQTAPTVLSFTSVSTITCQASSILRKDLSETEGVVHEATQ